MRKIFKSLVNMVDNTKLIFVILAGIITSALYMNGNILDIPWTDGADNPAVQALIVLGVFLIAYLVLHFIWFVLKSIFHELGFGKKTKSQRGRVNSLKVNHSKKRAFYYNSNKAKANKKVKKNSKNVNTKKPLNSSNLKEYKNINRRNEINKTSRNK